jgi:hypothetical protein
MILYNGPPEYTREIITEYSGELDFMSTIKMLADDPYRTELIIQKILELLAGDIHVFVFSDIKEPLYNIHKLLTERLKSSTLHANLVCTNDVLVGGAGKDEIREAYSDKNASVIFTTYRYSAVGISIKRMNALILVTPRRSKMRQIIGRIMRRGGDTNIDRQVYDIVKVHAEYKNYVK